MFECADPITSHNPGNPEECGYAAVFEGRPCITQHQCLDRHRIAELIMVARMQRNSTTRWDAPMTH
jgi:hypothetical protein